MTEEKPLRVQVAEALGWTITIDGLGNTPAPDSRYAVEIPDYDTDWSATGPLIHARGIALLQLDDEEDDEEWVAFQWDPVENYTTDDADVGARFPGGVYLTLDGTSDLAVIGATPLIAACKLIVALKVP